MLFKLPVQLLLAATSVAFASPLFARSDIQSLDTAIPDGLVGEVYARFQPYLAVNQSCKPYPAVSPQGDASPGIGYMFSDLKACNNSRGQVYARGTSPQDTNNRYGDLFPLLYTWYFPKRQIYLTTGERHDWQQAVVWLSASNAGTAATDYSIHHISLSQPRGYRSFPPPKTRDGTTRPLLMYQNIPPTVDKGQPVKRKKVEENTHGLLLTTVVGEEQPLVSWEKFTPEAKAAVSNDKNFNGKVAPFADSKFLTHLDAAFSAK